MIDLFELEQVFIEELSLILDYYITKTEDNGGVGQWESTPPREGDVGGSNPPTVKEREVK